MMVSIEQSDSVDIGIEHIEDVVPQTRRNVPALKKGNILHNNNIILKVISIGLG